MRIERFITHFDRVTKRGNGYLVQCPAHDDRNPSLSISEGEDGRTLLKCFAGCETEQIVGALGLQIKDLFADNGKMDPEPRIVKTYDYRNETGGLLYQVVRYEPKDFRQRRPNGDGWLWNLNGTRRVPYRLHDLVNLKAEVLFIAEGERDVDQLWSLDLPATCNPGGSGQWRQEYTNLLLKLLSPEKIVILADHDLAGWQHALQVAQSFWGKVNIKLLLTLPGLPAKGDVSDYLVTHSKGELLEFVDQCPALTVEDLKEVKAEIERNEKNGDAQADHEQQQTSDAKSDNEVYEFLQARIFVTRDLGMQNALVPGIGLTPGGAGEITGASGIGKSMLTLAVAASWSQGEAPFGCEHLKPSRALRIGLANLEDPPFIVQDRLYRMLQGNHAPDGLFVFTRTEPITLATAKGRPDASVLAKLGRTLHSFRADLLILDPLVYLHDADENDAAEMVRWLRPLRETCREAGTAICLVHHAGHESGRGRGTTALRAWADWELNLEKKVTATGELLHLNLVKANFAPRWPEAVCLKFDATSFSYSMVDEHDTTCPPAALADWLRDTHAGEFSGGIQSFYEAAVTEFRCSQSTIERSARKAFQIGLMHREGRGLNARIWVK